MYQSRYSWLLIAVAPAAMNAGTGHSGKILLKDLASNVLPTLTPSRLLPAQLPT